MPKVTVWIRKEDYDKWCSIVDKPLWLHSKLTDVVSVVKPVVNSSGVSVKYTNDWGA